MTDQPADKSPAPEGAGDRVVSGTALPVWFVSHGAPTTVLADNTTTGFWRSLSGSLDDARAILMISAHWETIAPRVTGNETPQTIHDFYGFPAPLYEIRYTAPGSPEIAELVVAALQSAGLAAEIDPERGLDHGAWAPLVHIRPDADIPVLQLSVQPGRDADWHLRVGRALAELPRQGVQIIASGGAVHNIPAAMQQMRSRQTGTPDWARDFDNGLAAAVRAGDSDAAVALLSSPAGRMAHPTDEHLLPLFVAMGAAQGRAGTVMHQAFEYGSLSMTAFSFGDG